MLVYTRVEASDALCDRGCQDHCGNGVQYVAEASLLGSAPADGPLVVRMRGTYRKQDQHCGSLGGVGSEANKRRS